MRPYLYILGVLLVGGGIGYFIGQKSATFEHSLYDSSNVAQNDEQLILQILNRQSEAYRLRHPSGVQGAPVPMWVDGSTGEGRGRESVMASRVV